MDGPVNEPSNDYIQIFERQWLYPSQMCILDLLARPKASKLLQTHLSNWVIILVSNNRTQIKMEQRE